MESFSKLQLQKSEYIIILLIALFGVFYVWVFDAKRDKSLGLLSFFPFSRTPNSEIFLSYKSENAPMVRFIAEQMVAHRQSVWFNEYCVILGSWEDNFELPLSGGVAAAKNAVFFTNSKWAGSHWCTDIEAKPLLNRLSSSECLEVRLPFPPHPVIDMMHSNESSIPYIDAQAMDRWEILWGVTNKMGLQIDVIPHVKLEYKPLKGIVNGINYEINIPGWEIVANSVTRLGNLILPRLSRIEDGLYMSVNIIVGKTGGQGREINADDDREVFKNLRSFAKKYFEHMPSTGKCVGVHLVWNAGISHGAFTYWGRNGWCRKYDIILPAQDGGADIAFTFTCIVHGDFLSFCKHAWMFDDLVNSLKYGNE